MQIATYVTTQLASKCRLYHMSLQIG